MRVNAGCKKLGGTIDRLEWRRIEHVRGLNRWLASRYVSRSQSYRDAGGALEVPSIAVDCPMLRAALWTGNLGTGARRDMVPSSRKAVCPVQYKFDVAAAHAALTV